MKHKNTRQGVRDLNAIGPKPKQTIKLELPPINCKHLRAKAYNAAGDRHCEECDTTWDGLGNISHA